MKRFKVQNGVAAHSIASIHTKLGIPSIYMDEKRLVDALKHLHLAQEIYSKIGHTMGEATALFYTGYGYLLQNQLSSARKMAESGRAICHAISSQISKGELPSTEGMIFSDQSPTSEMQAVFLTLLVHICIREDCLTEANKLLKKAINKKKQVFSQSFHQAVAAHSAEQARQGGYGTQQRAEAMPCVEVHRRGVRNLCVPGHHTTSSG